MPDGLRNASEWPRTFQARFIQPGLVHYDDHGTVLVRRETIDRMRQSMVGKPVINVIHKDVEPDIYENGDADGIVTRVWYNPEDGWDWCEFLVWDKPTQFNCESNAYSVSCAYNVLDFKAEAGQHNNVPYQNEVIDGQYTHLAVVANPRYEDARIVVLNSKGGSNMKLFNFFKKEKPDVKNSADIEKTVVEVDGRKVSVKDLIEVHNARETITVENIADDTVIELDGKETTMRALKESYRAKIKNEADEDKDKKDKEAEERKNAEDEEKKKKDEEDLKNAEEKEKADKDKKDMENSIGKQHFENLKKAAERRGQPQEIKVSTQRDRVVVGRKKYGSAA